MPHPRQNAVRGAARQKVVGQPGGQKTAAAARRLAVRTSKNKPKTSGGGAEYRADLNVTREQMSADYEALQLEFITIELDLALTFCEIAVTTSDEERTQRNLQHARLAYEVAKKFLAKATLPPDVRRDVEQKVHRLEIQMGNLDKLEPGTRSEDPGAPEP
jgi:hypothetical protein